MNKYGFRQIFLKCPLKKKNCNIKGVVQGEIAVIYIVIFKINICKIDQVIHKV